MSPDNRGLTVIMVFENNLFFFPLGQSHSQSWGNADAWREKKRKSEETKKRRVEKEEIGRAHV